MGRIYKNFKVSVPDPRLSIIDERLRRVKRILIVASGKGGVGKSLLATALSLMLSRSGRKVGLLDLDFHGPSCHIILGAKGITPVEEKGIIPPEIQGLRFMSVVYYIDEKPLPLRGTETSNAFVELLTITRWGRLDYLIVDVPPGIAEEVLDIIRLIKRGKFLIVATPSPLALQTVARLIKLLREQRVPILGLVENMRFLDTNSVEELAKSFDITFLGHIPFDPGLEPSLGSPEKLLETKFARAVANIMGRIDTNGG